MCQSYNVVSVSRFKTKLAKILSSKTFLPGLRLNVLKHFEDFRHKCSFKNVLKHIVIVLIGYVVAILFICLCMYICMYVCIYL